MARWMKGEMLHGSATTRILEILEAFCGEWFTPEQLITEIDTRFTDSQNEAAVKRALHRLVDQERVESYRYYKDVSRVGVKVRVDWPEEYK